MSCDRSDEARPQLRMLLEAENEGLEERGELREGLDRLEEQEELEERLEMREALDIDKVAEEFEDRELDCQGVRNRTSWPKMRGNLRSALLGKSISVKRSKYDNYFKVSSYKISFECSAGVTRLFARRGRARD